jgi:hypothetical protein
MNGIIEKIDGQEKFLNESVIGDIFQEMIMLRGFKRENL